MSDRLWWLPFGKVPEISAADLKQLLDSKTGLQLIDVRSAGEFAAGHIKGAKHIGKGVIERDIEAKIPELDADIVLYCGGGFRSVLAAEALQKMGYTHVKSMAGGWREWVAAKGPTET